MTGYERLVGVRRGGARMRIHLELTSVHVGMSTDLRLSNALLKSL